MLVAQAGNSETKEKGSSGSRILAQKAGHGGVQLEVCRIKKRGKLHRGTFRDRTGMDDEEIVAPCS